MFKGQFQHTYKKLIEVIKAKNTAEAQKLIATMDITELSKATNTGDTALAWAASKGLGDVCLQLIPKMTDQAINHVNKNGDTALSLATKNGFKNICDLLTNKKDNLANKAATEKKQEKQQQSLKLDELKYNQLISAIRDNKAAEAEKLVKELNSDTLSKIDDNGNTALTLAASKGLSKVCLQLIPKMTDQAINTITKTYGTTALTCAAWKGLSEVCLQLISRMPDQTINHITNGGDTALTLAVWNGLEKVSELLIPRMTIQAIHHVSNKGETVLNLVIQNNLKKIYDLLNLRVNELNNQINKTNTYKNEEEKLIIEEEEDIYQIIGKIIFDLQDSNIDEVDKPIIENSLYRIVNKIQKLTDKNDIINITKSIKELIGNEITEGVVIDLEDEVKEMVEKQAQKKLNIFNDIVKKIITKLEIADTKDSAVIQTQIKEISSKVQTLENNVSIEQITNWMEKLINGKITRGTVIDLKKKIDAIMLQEINESTNVITFAVKEIIYDNPLLNHTKLLQTAVDSKLSPDLIQEAINNNDEGLILAGLMSMGYDVAKYI